GPDSTEPFSYEDARRKVPLCSAAEVEAVVAADNGTVIFTGTSEEFSAGHVPGSRWLSRSWLELRVDEIAPDKTKAVIVSSRSTDIAGPFLAAATLLDRGYADVRVLEGGIDAWSASGRPGEKGLAGVEQAPDDVLPARRSYAEML